MRAPFHNSCLLESSFKTSSIQDLHDARTVLLEAASILLLMDKVLHDCRYPKPWEFWVLLGGFRALGLRF